MRAMMIGALLLVALAAELPACADSPPLDAWTVKCKTDAMTDVRSCQMVYFTTLDPVNRTTIFGVSIGFAGAAPLVMVKASGGVCRDGGAMVRIDRKKTVTLLYRDQTGMLIGDAAAALIAQMKAGVSALVRVHNWPGCQSTDFHVSLRGFTARYNELLEERL